MTQGTLSEGTRPKDQYRSMDANELGDLLLEVLPPDGSTLGNLSALQELSKATEREVGEEEYDQIRDKAPLIGTIKKGRGRGGSIALGEDLVEAA